MKKQLLNISCALFLLLSFTIGQVIVYGHLHKTQIVKTASSANNKSKTTDDRCKICDQNTQVLILFAKADFTPFKLLSYNNFVHVSVSYHHFNLFHNEGRGPPVGIYA